MFSILMGSGLLIRETYRSFLVGLIERNVEMVEKGFFTIDEG